MSWERCAECRVVASLGTVDYLKLTMYLNEDLRPWDRKEKRDGHFFRDSETETDFPSAGLASMFFNAFISESSSYIFGGQIKSGSQRW